MSAKKYKSITGASKATTKRYLFIHKFIDEHRTLGSLGKRVR